jgi:aspartate carbamoyltransferase catalytic subunit
MRSRLGDLQGKRVVIVGDIAHSRVVRSNIWGLSALGAEIVVCAPPTLLPSGLRPGDAGLREPLALPAVTVETDLNRALEGANVVMALRLQLERMTSGLLPSPREYARLYQVNEGRLAHADPGALVMHPGPLNEGVEISPAVARSAQSVIEEQVTNGVAVRMAVLYLLSRGKP